MAAETLLHDRFAPDPLPHWTRHVVGAAALARTEAGVRLVLDDAGNDRYSDSQLDDFHGRARDEFLWRPPLALYVRARFSHGSGALRGTAGFGWWNAPFEGDRATEVGVGPQVLWFFFASPPSDLATTQGWSGHGWFAQALRAPALPGWLVTLSMWALRLPGLSRVAQRAAGETSRAAEQPLPHVDLTAWHDYRLVWRRSRAEFWIDDGLVLASDAPPTGPLALVLWIDNQWATVRGEGGLLDVPQRQWLELAEVRVTRLTTLDEEG